MKKMRQNSSRVALIALLLLLFPISLFSAQTVTIDNLKYTLAGDTAVVSGYGTQPTGDLVIPASVDQGGVSYRVTSIGSRAFYDCSSLTSVTLPESLTSIGKAAFRSCSSLTSVTFPTGLTEIGSYAFNSCSSLTSVTLPAGLTSIGLNAFDCCSSLTSVTLPAGLTSIGSCAFSLCSSLTSVTFPAGLTSIGEGAFYSCESLNELHVPIATPLEIEDNTFNGVPTTTCTLYVPIGSKAAYQAAAYWSDFENIVEEETTGTTDMLESGVRVITVAGRIVVDGAPEGATIEVYSLSGQLVACTTNTEIELPQRGVYIVRVGGVSFKVNA